MPESLPELSARQLRAEIDTASLPFRSTRELEAIDAIIGQDRAVRAMEFGLSIDSPGYNIYVTGSSESGRMSAVRSILQKLAGKKTVPPDWLYVQNFENKDEPVAFSLPPGKGRVFQHDMEELIETLRRKIPKAFRSDEYKNRKEELLKENAEKRKAIIAETEKEAKDKNFQIVRTSFGFTTVPVKEDGTPLKEEEYKSLSPDEKRRTESDMADVQQRIAAAFARIQEIDKESKSLVNRFNEEMVSYVVARHLEPLEKKYADVKPIASFLQQVKEDIIAHQQLFLAEDETPQDPRQLLAAAQQENAFNRYSVNVVVDNTHTEGAPVVVEGNPTYGNLFGRLERKMAMGVFVTDFTQIKAGTVHQANGGFLVVNVERVLMYPFVWEGLKRILQEKEIKIEDVTEQYGLVSTTMLKPQPIPLNIKVIMIGRRQIFDLMYYYDEVFRKVFKVRADFDWDIGRNEESIGEFARFVSGLCRDESLRHFDRSGVAALVGHSSRLANHRGKLSLVLGKLANVVREADYWAGTANASLVSQKHVQKALEEQEFRNDMMREKIEEMIAEETLYIDTEGERVGQINGLAVYTYGEYSFGKPTRITARAFMGSKGVVNIEREAKLSGRTHDKGVLILSGYFGGMYGLRGPLPFSATITFEQSYSMIEGDSASAAELFGILSSLADVPIRQYIAVTGSVNQQGDIQPIGGVNEKIEGFFDTCRAKGPTGKEGVVIPQSNVKHLMLKQEVVDAVKDGNFHIWPISSVGEGIELVTGLAAGERGPTGQFPEDSIHGKVEAQLLEFLKERVRLKKLVEAEEQQDSS